MTANHDDRDEIGPDDQPGPGQVPTREEDFPAQGSAEAAPAETALSEKASQRESEGETVPQAEREPDEHAADQAAAEESAAPSDEAVAEEAAEVAATEQPAPAAAPDNGASRDGASAQESASEAAGFEAAQPDTASEDGGDLHLDLDGYEGPIDVLLNLARDQKVDLKKISILELADQYLGFVARARRLRLELAADYLVMAAWLAYLKSRLLLPEPPSDGEPSGAEMAAALAFQLQRLEAMQKAGQALLALPQLGRDFFRRGEPEPVRLIQVPFYTLTLYDLLKAYGTHPGRKREGVLHIEPLRLFSMDDALHRIGELLGYVLDWTTLRRFLPDDLQETPLQRRAAMAATFAATLELARSGRIQLRQDGTFGPIYVRRAEPQSEEAVANQGNVE
ncbi:ScpA family protein [Dongia soli]|uniref:Segregation and condensation protein A n=1 Tax=Dongia soli TaxID=600628 RepID=A0ABU5EID4_9PROT|nr:ScpA family protein [Dongia soli]MDY0885096.1 ScpA family protein [Dongia soli]